MAPALSADYRLRICESKSDAKHIHEFVVELADCAGRKDSVVTTPEMIYEDMSGTNPKFVAAVAEHFEDETWIPVGYSLWYYAYSTWKGRTAHLDDIFVREAHRRNGLGTALFKLCVEQVYKNGAVRLDWVVLKWNDRAKSMYLSLGAKYPKDNIWDDMEMDKNAMKELLASSSDE